MPSAFTRRHLLRVGGACLALPWLEAFDPPAAAAPPRGRAVFFMVSSGVNMWRWVPAATGPDYALSSTLEVLAQHRAAFTVCSGLCHHKDAGGGHYEVGAWLTGNPDYRSKDGPTGPNALSIDQHIARAIGGSTRLPSLVLSGPGGSSTISFDAQGNYLNAQNNLHSIHAELFGSPDVLQRLDRRRSVLDLVGDQAKALSAQLGQHDRRRFEQYTGTVREIESRLQADREYFASRPLGPASAELALDADPVARRDAYFSTLMDLVALALANDQTRVVSILSAGSGHEFFGSWPECGGGSHHGASHGSGTESEATRPKDFAFLAAHDRWWLKHLDRLLTRLKETPDADGGTLLDTTLVLYGSGMSWTHNAHNLPLLLAGGSALGLRHGRHLAFNPHRDVVGSLRKDVPRGPDTTMSDLLRTISERLGVPADGFGGSTRSLKELLG